MCIKSSIANDLTAASDFRPVWHYFKQRDSQQGLSDQPLVLTYGRCDAGRGTEVVLFQPPQLWETFPTLPLIVRLGSVLEEGHHKDSGIKRTSGFCRLETSHWFAPCNSMTFRNFTCHRWSQEQRASASYRIMCINCDISKHLCWYIMNCTINSCFSKNNATCKHVHVQYKKA